MRMSERIVSKSEFERLFTSRWARLRAFGIREIVLGIWECSWFAWLVGAPWRCKLWHHVVTLHEDYNEDAHAVECRYRQCDRCGSFYGYVE